MDMQKAVKDLRELMRLREELDAEIETAQDAIKAEMTEKNVYELRGSDYKVTWKEVTTARIDGKALKIDLPEIAAKYTRQTTSRRFCVA